MITETHSREWILDRFANADDVGPEDVPSEVENAPRGTQFEIRWPEHCRIHRNITEAISFNRITG